MSSELLVNILQKGTVQPVAEGLALLYSFAGKLDAVCDDAGVSPLTTFFDRSGEEADLDALDLLIDNGAHLANQGTWFAPDALLETLTGLQAELSETPRRFGLLSNKYAQVMDELAKAIAAAEFARDKGAQLHLLVV